MTAVREGLRSTRLCLIAAVLLLTTACAASPVALATPSPQAKGDAPSPPPIPTGAKGDSPSPIPGVPSPSARCVARPSGGPMALIGQALYDVTDPVHPRLLCQITNTVAHLLTGDTFAYIRRSGDSGTEVVLHSIGSGNESVIAGWPIKLLATPFGNVGAWTADGNTAATAMAWTDGGGNQWIQIWLFSQPSTTMLFEFNQPLTDCICRFGLPEPTLAFSPDGQYLAFGWPIGKGAMPLRVFRVADRRDVADLDPGEVTAVWDRTGHRLYVTGRAGTSRSWTPEGGYAPLAGATAWPYQVGLSPDGSQVAYTAYLDPANFADLRVYTYDVPSHTTRLLTNQMRSEATFVRNRWVWYLEEAKCDSAQPACAPWGTGPTARVFAMDLTTGTEAPVVFSAGESPAELHSGWGPGEFWPSS